MARIAGINIPMNKHIVIGLTHFYGIGRPTSQVICAAAGVAPTTKTKDLTEAEVGALRAQVAKITVDGTLKTILGHGNGPVDGFVDAIRRESGLSFDVADYREHAIGMGANAAAVAYVELRLGDGSTLFGVGIDKNIVVASLKAVLSGVNRALKRV